MPLDLAIARQLSFITRYTDTISVRSSDVSIRKCSDLKTMVFLIKHYIQKYDDDYGIKLREQYDAFLGFLTKYLELKRMRNFSRLQLVVDSIQTYNENSFMDALNFLLEIESILTSCNPKTPWCNEPLEGIFTPLVELMFNKFDEFYTLYDLEEVISIMA